LVAAVAAVVLWVLVLLGVAFATGARGVVSGPATMDLGEEPPAVVDLLTNDWRVTPDAIPAGGRSGSGIRGLASPGAGSRRSRS
jgi:hypothetical protein